MLVKVSAWRKDNVARTKCTSERADENEARFYERLRHRRPLFMCSAAEKNAGGKLHLWRMFLLV
jgi:hypothetical protein